MGVAPEKVSKPQNIRMEREGLRSDVIITFSSLFLVIGIFLLVNISDDPGRDLQLLKHFVPGGLFCATAGIAVFNNRVRPFLAASLLAVTIPIVVAWQQILIEYQVNFYYLLPLFVLIGLVFVRHHYILILPAIPVISVLVIDATIHGSLLLTLDTLYIAVLATSIAAVGYEILDDAQGLIAWAVDSQNKNYVRAESFYNQGEQLRKATYDLEQAKVKVEEISRAKSVFLSNMSHELRTPLNMVIGYTSSILDMPQMYENQEVPEIFRKDIELIKSSGEYLLTLINDILDLSKIESGKFEINPVAFDIMPVLEGVMATALGLVKDKPVQLKPDYDDDLPLIYGDPMRIRQILLNLMSNGVKYTMTGSVTLSVHGDGDQIHLAIIDTGMGIPEETVATIFDRFEQAQHNSNIQGTGLGLDISQRLANMHGAEIKIKSTVGVGSTFSFTLPLATSEQSGDFTGDETIHELTGIKRFDLAKATDVAGEEPETTWETTRTVLIAEDDSVTRDLMIRTFKAHNYTVFDVQDGDDVFDTASALLPQLIILDIVLPNKDGWAILDDLKADEDTANIPVIVLSAYIDADTRPGREKAERCLSKPVNMNNVLKYANEAIDNQSQLQDA